MDTAMTTQDDKMLELHLEGRSYRDIAATFGVSHETARKGIERADPEGFAARQKERRRGPTPQTLALIKRIRVCGAKIEQTRQLMSTLAARRADLIRSALEAGASQADVARALGVTPNAISNVLRQH